MTCHDCTSFWTKYSGYIHKLFPITILWTSFSHRLISLGLTTSASCGVGGPEFKPLTRLIKDVNSAIFGTFYGEPQSSLIQVIIKIICKIQFQIIKYKASEISLLQFYNLKRLIFWRKVVVFPVRPFVRPLISHAWVMSLAAMVNIYVRTFILICMEIFYWFLNNFKTHDDCSE